MSRMLAMLLPLALLSSCPRVNPEAAEAKAAATATHPWEAPGYQGPELVLSERNRAVDPAASAEVEARPERGPEFPASDTVDISKLEGFWQVVAISFNEQLQLLPVSEQDTFIFQNGRNVIYHQIANWKDEVREGTFEKVKPGVIGLKFGVDPIAEFYSVLYRDDFLFMWNYEQKVGWWMARLPGDVTERVAANRFDTTRGEMVLNDVVATSFMGQVTGERPLGISGFYSKGILSVRWEEADRSGTGFAMFIVGPDWQTLKGAWWVDDYEAEPFAGLWDGTKL